MNRNGYAHRNLRPENILFETEQSLAEFKLLDLLTIQKMSVETGYPVYEEQDD
jgi:serine/threonine protein kinase